MPRLIALVRRPSRRLGDGLVTHLDRVSVDADLAAEQHARYVEVLARAGWEVHDVVPADDHPDSAFVEDTVVVFDGLAVLARPGAPERQGEVAGAEDAVRALGLEVARIEEPGTLDGGDVLRIGSTLYVGRGGRTDEDGIKQLGEHIASRGGRVVPVALDGVLHLKSAVTALPDGTIVCADERLVDTGALPRVQVVPEEAGSHVVLLGRGRVLMAASAPRSAERLREAGLDVITVDISEFEKMEGCVTCLSVLVEAA